MYKISVNRNRRLGDELGEFFEEECTETYFEMGETCSSKIVFKIFEGNFLKKHTWRWEKPEVMNL